MYTLLPCRNPFDVHVYYDGVRERDRAMALRGALCDAMPWMRFMDPIDTPIGPHPVPMWEADFAGPENTSRWGEVVAFLEGRHATDGVSILVHPHTTEGSVADHTKHAHWIGQPKQLILAKLK